MKIKKFKEEDGFFGVFANTPCLIATHGKKDSQMMDICKISLVGDKKLEDDIPTMCVAVQVTDDDIISFTFSYDEAKEIAKAFDEMKQEGEKTQ